MLAFPTLHTRMLIYCKIKLAYCCKANCTRQAYITQLEYSSSYCLKYLPYLKSSKYKLYILLYVPCIIYSLLCRPTNAQHYTHTHTHTHTFLMIFFCPYIFYTHSLQDYTYKTVLVVYAATKETANNCHIL
jgi:hypothetical protein